MNNKNYFVFNIDNLKLFSSENRQYNKQLIEHLVNEQIEDNNE